MSIFSQSKSYALMKKLIFYLVLFAFNVQLIQAQTDYDNVPEVTGKIFIKDVYIFQTAFDSLGLGDVLIENGLISKVAVDIDAPSDARVIECDSCYLYPAFIDGMSNAGIPNTERSNERPKIKFRGYPPDDVAGITPQIKASDVLEHNEKSIDALKKEGFAISHSVPMGGMLPGKGCIISLHGEASEELILMDDYSCYFKLDGARGVYPSTVIAVMAKWRDLLKNTRLYNQNIAKYEEAPLGLKRPQKNAVYDALTPAAVGKQRIFAEAKKLKEVYRQIELKKELDYELVLADVKQVDPAMEMLKTKQLGVLLSLDLPKKDKEEKKKEGKKEKVEEIDSIGIALKERKEKSLKEYESQAAILEKEGIPFAFSTLSVKSSEIKENLNRMIEAGLSREAALNALTLDAAKILGIDNITGSLHEGKMANMFLSTKNYFDRKSDIKFLLVEGNVNEFDIKKSAKKNGEFDKSILGTWTYSVDVMGDVNKGTIKISGEQGQLEMFISNDDSPGEDIECEDVSLEDGQLSASLTIPGDGSSIAVSLSLEMEEDSFSGTANIEGIGAFPIEGSKISSPENKLK